MQLRNESFLPSALVQSNSSEKSSVLFERLSSNYANLSCGCASAASVAHSVAKLFRGQGPEFKGSVIELERANDRIQAIEHLEGHTYTISSTGGALDDDCLPSSSASLLVCPFIIAPIFEAIARAVTRPHSFAAAPLI